MLNIPDIDIVVVAVGYAVRQLHLALNADSTIAIVIDIAEPLDTWRLKLRMHYCLLL
ncbi:hypothetical protein BIS06_00705 [Halomonas sp. BBD48]|nr:hypothetical protein [Halomonas sp. BBD48]